MKRQVVVRMECCMQLPRMCLWTSVFPGRAKRATGKLEARTALNRIGKPRAWWNFRPRAAATLSFPSLPALSCLSVSHTKPTFWLLPRACSIHSSTSDSTCRGSLLFRTPYRSAFLSYRINWSRHLFPDSVVHYGYFRISTRTQMEMAGGAQRD